MTVAGSSVKLPWKLADDRKRLRRRDRRTKTTRAKIKVNISFSLCGKPRGAFVERAKRNLWWHTHTHTHAVFRLFLGVFREFDGDGDADSVICLLIRLGNKDYSRLKLIFFTFSSSPTILNHDTPPPPPSSPPPKKQPLTLLTHVT